MSGTEPRRWPTPGASTSLTTAFVDQVVASAAWYVPVLLVGRAAEPGEFGAFLVAYGALAMLVAVSRAMFGVVVGMDAEPDARPSLGRPVAGVLVLAVAGSVVLGLAALLVPVSGTLVALLGLSALLVLPQDLARYAAAAGGTPGRALVTDLVWLVPCLAGLVVDVVRGGTMTATQGLLLWLAATAASLTVAVASGLLARPQAHGLWTWWRDDARRRHLATDSLLSGVVPVGNGWGAALVAGATAVAAVRGAAMLFAPVVTVMMAMTLAAVPEARRRSAEAGTRFLVTLTGAAVVAATLWGVVVVLLPDALGRELLGESWAVASPLLPIVCVEYVGLVVWAGGAALLRFRSATDRVLAVRLVYAPLALVVPVAALAVTDDPRAFVLVLAVLAWLVGVAALTLGLRAARATP